MFNNGKKKGKVQGKSPAPSKKTLPAGPKVPAEWLYLAPSEVTPKMIFDALAQTDSFADTEYWEEAGVAEIPIGDKASMDMERTECRMDDEIGNSFLKENKAAELYLVTIVPEASAKAQEAMHCIIASCGGFFCGDTEDFLPLVK